MTGNGRTWMHAVAAILGTSTTLLVACGLTDPAVCTAEIRPAVIVRPMDALSGQLIAEGAGGTVSEGSYVDSLRVYTRDGTGQATSLAAAGERPGTYSIRVEHPGYQPASLDQVRVTGGSCHVQTRTLDVAMVPGS